MTTMHDRTSEIDDLAARVFLAEHVCTRDVQEPDDDDDARDVALWMEVASYDYAPVKGSRGRRLLRYRDLVDSLPGSRVRDLARETPDDRWLDASATLSDTLKRLTEKDALILRRDDTLVGIVTLHDLGRPIVSSYLLALLLNIERGLRRLYGSYTHTPVPDEPPKELTASLWTLANVLKKVSKKDELRADLGHPSATDFRHEHGWLVNLRNDLAHGRTILGSYAPLEAVQRIDRLKTFAKRVQKLLANRDQLWDAFADSVIEEQGDTSRRWAGPGALPHLPLPEPTFVVSAQNPHEQVLPEAQNGDRHRSLKKYFDQRFPQGAVEVVGRSQTGTWCQASWGISGIPRSLALDVAAKFGQRAIFELTADVLRVIAIDGTIHREKPRVR